MRVVRILRLVRVFRVSWLRPLGQSRWFGPEENSQMYASRWRCGEYTIIGQEAICSFFHSPLCFDLKQHQSAAQDEDTDWCCKCDHSDKSTSRFGGCPKSLVLWGRSFLPFSTSIDFFHSAYAEVHSAKLYDIGQLHLDILECFRLKKHSKTCKVRAPLKNCSMMDCWLEEHLEERSRWIELT